MKKNSHDIVFCNDARFNSNGKRNKTKNKLIYVKLKYSFKRNNSTEMKDILLNGKKHSHAIYLTNDLPRNSQI